MRAPIFKITNDDDPMCIDYPMALSLAQIRDADEENIVHWSERARVRESMTVGGGAAVQFTIERIR